MKSAYEILNNPFLNKGTAFTHEERQRLGLTGLLPHAVQTIDQQSQQAYAHYNQKPSLLEKRQFLMEIFNTNRTLFYHLFGQHIVEMMPIVYDPVIAQSIEQYSELFINPQNAVYLSPDNQADIADILTRAADGRDIRLIVATDAEGILGIGDWGCNGVDIAVGKLMVYTAAAGIPPESVLPVVLDVGTDRQALLDNPLYLGNRQKRLRGEAYYQFVDAFVNAAERVFHQPYLHWEDFGRSNAANVLHTYQDRIATFNDDIQGTGIITLAGILGALAISKEKLADQTYVCFGAGTAGCGIAHRVYTEMLHQGLPENEARARFYLVDKQGLLFDDMDDLTPEQRPFARRRSEFANASELTSLTAVVKTIKPTILVGTSTRPNTFTQEIVETMSAHTARPIIFPLSNPTKLAEATAADLITWSQGKALVATGIPADPVFFNGVHYTIGQANNALIYPGLGLGVLAANARRVSDEMISRAAHSLSGLVNPDVAGAAVLPPVAQLTEFSQTVAHAVAQCAIEQGLNREPVADIGAAIDAIRWTAEYR